MLVDAFRIILRALQNILNAMQQNTNDIFCKKNAMQKKHK
jgi:hypothetical protein